LPNYRIYHVGNGGRLRLGDLLQAPHDEAAVASAATLLTRGQEAELWQGGRLVGRFSARGEFLRGHGG
jgi:hypothetical protein